jgi:hypothetical protein
MKILKNYFWYRTYFNFMSSHPVMIEGVVLMKATKNKIFENKSERHVACSVADPDPDPHVLGLLDPDPLVRSMDPDPAPDLDPYITKQK